MKRRTGRTTRMLTHAIELEEKGESICIICANKQHAVQIFDQLIRMIPNKDCVKSSMEIGRIKIRTPDWFDWERMIMRGEPLRTIHLADHFAIESRFSLMLKELTAYDD